MLTQKYTLIVIAPIPNKLSNHHHRDFLHTFEEKKNFHIALSILLRSVIHTFDNGEHAQKGKIY